MNMSAKKADRHVLYQKSVQEPEAELDFVSETFETLRGRPLELIREDFCGTAHTATAWVERGDAHRAIAVDLDGPTLQWGRENNLARLSEAQRQRIELYQTDVRTPPPVTPDAVLAMNFSYYLFLTREDMIEYFRTVRESLADDGILFLDCFGGSDAPKELREKRKCDGFTYIWEQASYNPINGQMQCYIHFRLPDGTRMDRAFEYYWRLWTIPELRECLADAGFAKSTVYWEGTDEDTGEGDGVFEPSEEGTADPGWIAYIVAEK